jgi:hypothetical protein
MADFTPSIIPLGSLADAAAASSEVAQEEQLLYSTTATDIGTTTGIIAEPPTTDWP